MGIAPSTCLAFGWFLIGFWMSQPYSASNRLSTQLFLYPAVGFLLFGCVLMCGDADEEKGNKVKVTQLDDYAPLFDEFGYVGAIVMSDLNQMCDDRCGQVTLCRLILLIWPGDSVSVETGQRRGWLFV